MIIEMDTRNKKDDFVTKYFDKQGINGYEINCMLEMLNY